MSEKTIARGPCLICGAPAEIRRNVKGKLYAFCLSSCGLVQATGIGAQARFTAMIPPAGDPVPPADDVSGLDNPAGQPDHVPPPKKGIFAAILDAQIL